MVDHNPQLSLALPFYNEEECAREVVLELEEVLNQNRVDYELLLVDNGSVDKTGAILAELNRLNPRLHVVTVPVNQGFGWGILQGLAAARGRFVGYLCADGQIVADDVLRVYRALEKNPNGLAKVVRVSRGDGVERKFISLVYNALFGIFFGLSIADVNGTPKMFDRRHLSRFRLASKDWFIDAEVMIKATLAELPIELVPVEFHSRKKGHSHVRFSTILEFLKNIVRYRFGGEFNKWKTHPS